MSTLLKNFISGDHCLSCKGCCRFSAQKSSWAPFFTYEEISDLTRRDLVPSCLFTHANLSKECGTQIDLVAQGDRYLCPCFEPASNRCKIYSDRPLDCQLYPFLLARRGKDIFCALDENCSYIQKVKNTDQIVRYAQYLIVYFSTQEFWAIIEKNPGLIQDYGENVAYIKRLSVR
ncbi:MAG: YkgJ family cysteine cluster protein [Candidatus Omnitrophota bacterium]